MSYEQSEQGAAASRSKMYDIARCPQFEVRLPGDHGGTLKGSVAGDLALKCLADLQFKETLLLKPVRASINYIRTLRNEKLVKEHKVCRTLFH